MSSHIITNTIFIQCRWFVSIFKDVITIEGWGLFLDAPDVNRSDIYVQTLNKNITSEEIFELAREYGFVVANDGRVLDFNIENLTRNKHLLTASELGLL